MQGHQGDNQLLERKFLDHINGNYKRLVSTAYLMFNNNKKRKLIFDEDIFQDTIIKCYERLQVKKSMKDDSPNGMDCYFLKALYLNTLMKERYAWYKKRSDVDVNAVLKSREHDTSSVERKLVSDLKADYSILYIMRRVEEEFDTEAFYLYRLKMLCGMTYKEICNKTKIKGARNKILEVSTWVKDNITLEEIDNKFNEEFEMFL